MQHKHIAAFGLTVVLTAFAAGCDSGPKLAPVTGVVTLDDKPVQGLRLEFQPKSAETGATATGYTNAEGSYSLSYPGQKPGAPVGEYKVVIEAMESDEPGEMVKIPAKYNDNSELSAKVEPGENKIDFPLTSN